MDTLCMTLYNAPTYRLSSTFVAQRKAKVNGKNLLLKPFKALELEFILSFSFLRLNISLVFNLFYYNYATNLCCFVDFRVPDNKAKTYIFSRCYFRFCRKAKINRR